MKKVLSLFLAFLLLLSLAGCRTAVLPDAYPLTTGELAETTRDEIPGEEVTQPPETTEETTPPATEATQTESEGTIPPTTRPAATQPATTQPETTRPAVTQPPTTRPEETVPPVTQPPATQPPETESPTTRPEETQPPTTASRLDSNGSYYSKEDVAEFIVTYGRLPGNFMTKKQMGDNTKSYMKNGYRVGGDRFYNNEGLLPGGYTYYECDIVLSGTSRGAHRLVFTYSGLVYYTSDHYESFVRLY